MATSLVIADDHPIVLDGLQALFGVEGGFHVAARCTTGLEALEAARLHRPDVVILDLAMPGISGLETLRRIREEGLPCRVVLLAGAISEDQALEALRNGVDGILLKELAPQLLAECVRKVAGGERWLEKRSASRLIESLIRREADAKDLSESLTGREIELVKLVARGLRNKEIARQLRIKEGTVKIHMHNIYGKLDIGNRVQLVLYAQSKGLA